VPLQNSRAFQDGPAIVGGNEEKGAPESARCGPGIRDPPCTPCSGTFNGTSPKSTIAQTGNRACRPDGGDCEI
jgi:hypothetical protein